MWVAEFFALPFQRAQGLRELAGATRIEPVCSESMFPLFPESACNPKPKSRGGSAKLEEILLTPGTTIWPQAVIWRNLQPNSAVDNRALPWFSLTASGRPLSILNSRGIHLCNNVSQPYCILLILKSDGVFARHRLVSRCSR